MLTTSVLIAKIKTSFIYDKNAKITIENITKYQFKNFEGKVDEGLNNGFYWIKIENDHTGKIVSISSARIKKIIGYINRKKTADLNYFSFPTFEIGSNQILYLKVYCEKEASIPLTFYKKEDTIQSIQNQYLFYGLYYGFAIVIIILNFFYYFNFKENTFLFYSLFLIGVTGSLFYRDGIFNLLFNNKWIVTNGENILHFIAVGFGGLFASVYLRHEIHFPRLKFYTFTILCLTAIFFTLHSVTTNFIWFVAAELFGISILAIYWISSILLFNKDTFYAFFAIAYSLILLLAIDFFILPLLGLPYLGITTVFMKTASVFEMLILSFAVVYRMRILHHENYQFQMALFEHTTQIEKLEVELSKLKAGEKNKITASILNAREVEILTMISNGIPTKEMADRLFVSINTIKYHIKNLYDKLEISSRQEAKVKASEIQLFN